MGRATSWLSLIPLLTAAGGCGHDGSDGWETLVEVTWTVAPGVDDYVCGSTIVDEELYVGAVSAIAPLGTHHAGLGVTDGGSPDGQYACDPNELGHWLLYGGGAGTNDFVLPDGVALPIAAGEQVVFNVHAFNTGTEELSGTSGVRVRRLAPESVVHRAEVVLATTRSFFLPPHEETTATGVCNFTQDATIFAIWPHMHALGAHLKVIHQSGEGPVVLHDAPFSAAEQLSYPIAPVLVKAGETVDVVCTWNNTTDNPVIFGESALNEMCGAGLYRYPAVNEDVFCGMF